MFLRHIFVIKFDYLFNRAAETELKLRVKDRMNQL